MAFKYLDSNLFKTKERPRATRDPLFRRTCITILYSYFMARFKKYTSCVLFELDLSQKFLSKFFDNLDRKQISAIPHYIIDIFWHLCCHKGVIWIVRLMNIMSLECPCSGRLTRLKKWRLSQYTNTHGLHFLRIRTHMYVIVQCKKRVKHERTFVIEKDHVCISNKANYLLLI